eukprot:182522_1
MAFPSVSELQTALLSMKPEDCLDSPISEFFKLPACVSPLAEQMKCSTHASVRECAAICLRRTISKHFKKIGSQYQAQLKAVLLECLLVESDLSVRGRVSELACQVARYSVPVGEWPELLQWLEKCLEDAAHREMAMGLFSSLVEDLGEHFGSHFGVLIRIFGGGLKDASLGVRQSAMKGVGALAQIIKDDAQANSIRQLVPVILDAAKVAISEKSEEMSISSFDTIDRLAQSSIFDQFCEQLGGFCLEVLQRQDLQLTIRSRACQSLTWMSDSRSTQMLKLGLVSHVLRASAALLTEPESESHDVTGIPGSDPGSESAGKLGVELLSSLLANFESDKVFLPGMELAHQLLSSTNPNERKAAFQIIAVMADSEAESLRPKVEQILEALMGGLRDSVPTVRRHAASALGRLTGALGADVIRHAVVCIPELCRCLDREGETTDVLEAIVGALEQFLLKLDAQSAAPFVSVLAGRFSALFRADALKLKHAALTGLCALARAAGVGFRPFYAETATLLSELMGQTADSALPLRAMATKSMGVVTLAMGLDHCDVAALGGVVQLAVRGLEERRGGVRDKTFGFFGDIAELVGPDFIQFPVFSMIWGAVLESTVLDDGNQNNTGEIAGDPESSDEDDVDYTERDANATDMTELISEKISAIECGAAFAKHLKSSFLPHLGGFMDVLQGQEDFAHVLVRQAVMAAYAAISSMVVHEFPPSNGELCQDAANVVDTAISMFINEIKTESNEENVRMALQHMTESINLLGPCGMEGNVILLTEALIVVIDKETEGSTSTPASSHPSRLVEAALDTFVALARAFGARFYGAAACAYAPLEAYARSTNAPGASGATLGALGEVITQIGSTSLPLLSRLVPFAVWAINSAPPTPEHAARNASALQNAAFCLGACARVAGENAAKFAETAIGALQPVLALPRECGSVFHGARDNAFSALAKFLTACPRALPLQLIFPTFLNGLPLLSDMAENAFVWPCLMQIVQQAPVLIKNHFAQLINVLLAALADSKVQDDCKRQLGEFVRGISQQCGAELSSVTPKMSPEQQNILQQCMK